MKRFRAIIFGAMLLVTTFAFLPASAVYAQDLPTGQSAATQSVGICSLIKPICNAILGEGNETFTGTAAYNFLSTRFNTILSIIFLGIILLGVYVVVRAGIKFIQSQGDAGKIGEAQKAIQSVFLGIGAMFVGVVGIVLVLAFFGGTGLLNEGASLSFLTSSSAGSNNIDYCDVNNVAGCIVR